MLNIKGKFIKGPNVVLNGLVFYLDASNPKSYPGSGTVWTDLMNSGINGTLINGPSFITSSGSPYPSNSGSIVFDGTNDYVELNSNNIITGTNPFTFECFYTVINLNSGGEIFGNYGAGYTTNTIWISAEYGVYIDGAVYFPGSPIYGTNHMAVTRTSGGNVILYRNGVQVNSGTLSSSISTGANFRIGSDTNSAGGFGGERLNGRIYNQRLYNRVLTAAEILQNFNALRGRVGL